MTENTKQFLIKVLAVGAVLVASYYLFSPYQECTRVRNQAIRYDGSELDPWVQYEIADECLELTNW